MNASHIRTRRTTISARKFAYLGEKYTAQWIGTAIVYTDADGGTHEGTITSFDRNGYPVATFTDGRWARLDLTIEIVEGA